MSEQKNNNKIINVKSNELILIGTKEPKYELDYTGEDLPEHNGISKIYLTCPYCSNNSEFNTINTVISTRPLDKFSGQPRYFHTLSQCSNCNEIIYVLCEDYDFNPDYNFSYKTHFPRGIAPIYKSKVHYEIVELYTNAERSFFAQANISTTLVCKELIKKILTIYSYQDVTEENINDVFVKNGEYESDDKVKSLIDALNSKNITERDARIALEVCELLIKSIFFD